MKLLLVDAMNLIRRIYAAAPEGELQIEATQNRCLAAITRNAEQFQASHVAMVFEQKCQTWRHTLWPDYKLNRPPMPQMLADHLEAVTAYFHNNGLPCLDLAGWEADDVIATLADKAAFAGLQVMILSTDKGFCQLVRERISVRNHFDRFTYDPLMVEQKFGLRPQQLPDYWALTGDTTNHLPGVDGIGPKTAGQLLDRFGSLDHILVQLQQLEGKAAVKLTEQWQQALLTRILASLRLDVPLGINLQDLRWQAGG
jgi:protein Xni